MKLCVVALVWIAAACVRCQSNLISVQTRPDGIQISCGGSQKFSINGEKVLNLPSEDSSSGEYTCEDATTDTGTKQKIYVKFRSCDNCVELDLSSLVGILLGNVVATIAISVAVYLTVAHSRTSLSSSHRKSSDKQHLVPNEARVRAPNDHYQTLNPKGVQKDTYDVLTNRR